MGDNLRVQAHLEASLSHPTDRFREFDLAPVQGNAVLLLQRGCHVRIGHGAEQLAILSHPDLDRDLCLLQPGSEGPGFVQFPLAPLDIGGLMPFQALGCFPGGSQSKLTGQEKVARVAVRYFFGLARFTGPADVFQQNDLQEFAPLVPIRSRRRSRPVSSR
jgi:hypothetical protein